MACTLPHPFQHPWKTSLIHHGTQNPSQSELPGSHYQPSRDDQRFSIILGLDGWPKNEVKYHGLLSQRDLGGKLILLQTNLRTFSKKIILLVSVSSFEK